MLRICLAHSCVSSSFGPKLFLNPKFSAGNRTFLDVDFTFALLDITFWSKLELNGIVLFAWNKNNPSSVEICPTIHSLKLSGLSILKAGRYSGNWWACKINNTYAHMALVIVCMFLGYFTKASMVRELVKYIYIVPNYKCILRYNNLLICVLVN